MNYFKHFYSNLVIFTFLLFFSFSVNAQTCGVWYVSSSGGGTGAGPGNYATLTTALSGASSGDHIQMLGGTYTFSSAISLKTGVTIEGSYEYTGGIWRKNADNPTNITFNTYETVSASGTDIRISRGFYGTSLNNFRLQDLNITVNRSTSSAYGNRGISVYGLYLYGCSSYQVVRCVINTGDASLGTAGSSGGNGSAGSTGGTGSQPTCGYNNTGGAGGAGGGGGAACTSGAGNSGTAGSSGGIGGAGGDGSTDGSGTLYRHGFVGGTGGGSGLSGGSGGTTQRLTGGAGSTGGAYSTSSRNTSGSTGSSGTASHTGGFYLPGNGSNGNGGYGGRGGGGGGGGGGGWDNDGSGWVYPGNGGAGGGGGGGGACGGSGGGGGGATFAVYLWANGSNGVFTDCLLNPGTAASGQAGGSGGTGGAGGAGGTRLTTTCYTTGYGGAYGGYGGSGGRGQAGGNGGTGGTGSTGVRWAMAQQSGGTAPTFSGCTVNSSATCGSTPADPASPITAQVSGEGCTYSEIILTKGTGSWVYDGGMTWVNNLTSSTTSYSTSTTPAGIYYTGTGRKTINHSLTGNYNEYFNINATRTAPVISAVSDICVGGAVSPTITAGYSSGNTVNWELTLVSNPTNILQSSTSTTPSFTINTAGSYQLRLIVTSTCCGRSIPAYRTFTVVADPSVGVPSFTNSTICSGGSTVATSIVSGGTGTLSYQWQYYSGTWNNVSNGAPTGAVYTNTTSTSLTITGTTATGSHQYRLKVYNSLGCYTEGTGASYTVVADPLAPTATKSPNVASVCAGQSLTLTGVTDNGGGTGCTIEYNHNGVGWTSTLTPITASVGTNTIAIRKTCSGSGCDDSDVNTYSWNVVADPSVGAPSYSHSSICSGGSTVATSSVSGGTGTLSYQWQYNSGTWGDVSNGVPTGASYSGNTSTSLTITGTTATGNHQYRLKVYNSLGCYTEGTGASYTVVADPNVGAPSYTNSTICSGGSTVATSTVSGGTGTISLQWQYNNSGTWANVSAGIPAGASYSGETSTSLTISGTTAVGTHQYRLKASNSLGCYTEGNGASYTVVADPVVQTITGTPVSGSQICAGSDVSATFSGNTGGTGTVTDHYEYTITGAAPWSAYTAGGNVTSASTGVDKVQIRTWRTATGSGCDVSETNIAKWEVVENPVAPSLNVATPANEITICAGAQVSATLTSGTGGGAGATNEYRYCIDGGTSYSVYVSGTAINTASATGDIIIQSRRTSTSSGCSTTAWTTCATWYLSSNPIAPTLNVATPATSNIICAGYSVSATSNAGSGGSTGAVDEYEYSLNNGSTWVSYTIGNPIPTTGATDNVIIHARRTSGDYGCVNTSWTNIATWSIGSNPIAATLSSASPVNGTSVCAGFNTGTVTGIAGSGGSTGAIDEYELSIDGGSNWVSYTNGSQINTDGATGNIIVRVRRTGGDYGCSASSWTTLNTWTLGSVLVQPSLTLANPANGSNICVGYNVGTVSITAGSGGSENALDFYEYSIDGGSNYTEYISGSQITTTGGSGSVIVRGKRTGGDYGCVTPDWTILTSWDFSSVPVAPTLAVASPTNGTTICAGYNVGTVTGSPGSGGSDGAVDQYEVSIDGGTSWTSYISGNSITTTGATSSVIVHARRTGGNYGCATTAWSNINSWTVGDNPQAPTLSEAIPANGSTICVGYNSGSVTATGGSGGSTGATNEYQYSIDGGGSYSSYNSGDFINTDAATSSVLVQARRTGGDYGCSNTAWNTISAWTTVDVPEYPTLSSAIPINGTDICRGANPSATFIAGTGGSGCLDSYQYSVNGVDWDPYIPGSTTIITGVGATTVEIQARRICSASGCDNTADYITLANWTVVDDALLSDVSFSNEIICTGGSTEATSLLTGGAGDAQLQWKFLNGASWENVTGNHPAGALYAGVNTEVLSISGITSPGTYRYKLTTTPTGAGCDAAESISATFEVVSQPSVIISGSDVTVCTDATLSYTATGSNGAGVGSYLWQSSTDNSSWVNIDDETLSEYTVPTQNTGILYYRAGYTTANSGCGWQYSNSRKVTVVLQPSLTIPTLTNNTICAGGSTVISSTLSNNGTGTPSYQWEYNNSGSWESVVNGTPTGASYANSTTTSMTISNITDANTHDYRLSVSMTGIGCNIVNSNSKSLVVVQDPSLSNPLFTNPIICSQGSTEVSSILSNGTGTASYQWQYFNGSIWINVANNAPTGATYTDAISNSLTIDGTTIPGTYDYKLTLTMDGNGCDATESASESYVVVADPSLSAASFTIETICAGGTTEVSSTLSDGTGSASYQWLYNNSGSWENVTDGNPTGAIYTDANTEILNISGTTSIGIHEYKLSVSMDGEACNSTESTSSTFTVVADPEPQTISEAPASGSVICIGANVNAIFAGGSGGTGIITDIYESSIDAGIGWSDYTPGTDILTTTHGIDIMRIRTQRIATGEGCDASSFNTVEWTVVQDPELSNPLLTNSIICSGGSSVISSTLSNGIGTTTYQWEFFNGSDWENVSNGTPSGAIYSNETTDEMSIDGITLIGDHSYRLRVSMTGLDCNTAYSNSEDLTVVASPSLSVLSYSNSEICVGGATELSSSLSNGTGTPTYIWEYYNGSDWSTVINGTPSGSLYSNTNTNQLSISDVTVEGDHQYRLSVSMDGDGCASTQTSGLAYTVNADPVSKIISESPAEGTIICESGTVSAGFNGGSGGAATITDHYEYSINAGTDWISYTPGNPVDASGVGTNYMRFRTWRSATGSGCESSAYNTKQWTVVANPQAPTATKIPNTGTVCQNQLLTIEDVEDAGGGTGSCEIQYRYTSNGGDDWSSWSVSIPAFNSVVDESNTIQARKQCNGYGCIEEIAIFNWDAVDEMELENPSFTYPVICSEGSTVVTTAIIGSAGTDQPEWQYLDPNTLGWNNVSDGTPTGAVYTNSNELSMTISGVEDAGLYYYRAILNIPNSGCEETQSNAATLRVKEQPSAPIFALKSPNVASVCEGQSLSLSGVAEGGVNQGVDCSLEYRYFNGTISAESSSIPTFSAVAGENYIEARRVNCQSGCNPSDWNSVAEWNVAEQPTVNILNNAEITCENDALTLNVEVLNGTGSHSYQWQSSTDEVSWADIPSETNSSYTVQTNSIGITYYRVQYEPSGPSCDAVFSNVYEVDVRNIPEVIGIQAGDCVWVGNVDNNWFIPENWRLYDGSSYTVPSTAPISTNNIYIVDENSCVNRKIVNISGIEVEFKNITIDEGFELRLID